MTQVRAHYVLTITEQVKRVPFGLARACSEALCAAAAGRVAAR